MLCPTPSTPVAVSNAQVDSLAAAIDLVNANPYGNGTAIFTDSGSAARRFQHDVQVTGARACVWCADSAGGVAARAVRCACAVPIT
jgi:acyl-CoA reductase-like NAD-dependent aldehyde dehydrogenase